MAEVPERKKKPRFAVVMMSDLVRSGNWSAGYNIHRQAVERVEKRIAEFIEQGRPLDDIPIKDCVEVFFSTLDELIGEASSDHAKRRLKEVESILPVPMQIEIKAKRIAELMFSRQDLRDRIVGNKKRVWTLFIIKIVSHVLMVERQRLYSELKRIDGFSDYMVNANMPFGDGTVGEKVIKALTLESPVAAESIQPSHRLGPDLGIDSMGVLYVCAEIEGGSEIDLTPPPLECTVQELTRNVAEVIQSTSSHGSAK